MALWENNRVFAAAPISVTQYLAKCCERLALPQSWQAKIAIATLATVGRLPRKAMLLLGAGYGRSFYFVNRKRRGIAHANLEMCFPHWPIEKRFQVARDHFQRYGQAIVDFGMLWLADEERINRCISYKGIENWSRAYSNGKPVIFLTPHMIAVDLAGILLSRHVPVCNMSKDLKNPILNQRLRRGRERFGAKIYSRSEGIRPLIRELKNNVACYYVPDEDLGLKHSKFVPFFGVQAATLTSLGRIAKVTNAVVLPLHAYLDPKSGQYYVEIEKPLENFPTNDEYTDARRMNAVFENIILKAPEQYMWTLRWFKTRPQNEPPVY